MLQYVQGFLGFGFLGLSFLLVYMGYNLIKTVLSRDNHSPGHLNIARFFLKTAWIFMLSAGPLQWMTMYFTKSFSTDTVDLEFAATPNSWSPDFGHVFLLNKKADRVQITGSTDKARETYANKEAVVIELSDVITSIQTLSAQLGDARRQVKDLENEVNSGSEERLTTVGGG